MSAPHRGSRCHSVSLGIFLLSPRRFPAVTSNITFPMSPGVTFSVRSPLPPSLLVVAFRLPLEMGEDVADALLLLRAEAVEGGLDLALHLRVADREAKHFDHDVLQ